MGYNCLIRPGVKIGVNMDLVFFQDSPTCTKGLWINSGSICPLTKNSFWPKAENFLTMTLYTVFRSHNKIVGEVNLNMPTYFARGNSLEGIRRV